MKDFGNATWVVIVFILVSPFAQFACVDDDDDDFEEAEEPTGGEPFGDSIALFGYCVDKSRFFVQHLTPMLGDEMTTGRWDTDHTWRPVTYFTVDGEQFVMGHGVRSGDRYEWFIQEVLPTGDIGWETDSGTWAYKYETLIPLVFSDKTFIFGQDDDNDNWWFVQEILPGGKLGHETDNGTGRYFYQTTTPLPMDRDDRACFFAHTAGDHDHFWTIDCINRNGELWGVNHGNFDTGYQVSTAYMADGQTYLFGHRHDYHALELWYYGPWFIDKIGIDGEYDDGTDVSHGTWHNYYKTVGVFEYPPTETFYLVGENTDNRFFIQHVTWSGKMGDEIFSTEFSNYYDYFYPIQIDSKYYQTDDWMGNQNDLIGERMLAEIAIPGSHDSGMNRSDFGDCFPAGTAKKCNTITQKGDVAFQLDMGARFFDLRPVLASDSDGADDWCTGHTTKNNIELYGCKGESKISIVDAIHDFFDSSDHSKEIVILRVSHCVMRKSGMAHDCTMDQLNNLAKNLAWHFTDDQGGELFTCNNCKPLEMKVNDILGNGTKGKVIVVVSGKNIDGSTYIDVNGDPSSGIFLWNTDFHTYDNWADTLDFSEMRNDQLGKLQDFDRYEYGWPMLFLLSWILSLGTGDVLFCNDIETDGIIGYSLDAQWKLYREMTDWVDQGWIKKDQFPNILFVDDFNGSATRAAIYLNEQYENLDD